MTLNYSAVFEHHARRGPDREVICCGDRRLTYAQFVARANAAAQGLLDLGVKRGDRVAVLLLNCPEFLEAIVATNKIGAIFLPLNWRLAGAELAYILNHAEVRALVTEPEFYPVVSGVTAEVPSLTTRLTLDDVPPAGWESYEQLVQARLGVRVPDADVGLDDLHRLMYTSGTTAHPKGVMLSYGNLYWKNVGHIVEFGLNADERTLVVGPLYHAGGLDLPATGTLHAGGSVVLLRRFDATQTLALIERELVTSVWLAPTMVNAILQLPNNGDFDLSSLRLIIDGGEKMPVPLIEKLRRVFPNAWFADAYGLTETVSGDTFLEKEKTIEKIGSVGRPVVHLAVRIVDDEGRELPANQLGEVTLRGPKVFQGYWRNPEATAAAIRSGWFHTGDIGYLDDEGYLYLVDRKKDMILSGGENIASLEVERVLYEHPAVLEAAVVGRPDARWGEVPVAFVALKASQKADEATLIEHCRAKLARFKVPKQVFFIDALPRNPSGKVLKRELREQAKEAPSGAA